VEQINRHVSRSWMACSSRKSPRRSPPVSMRSYRLSHRLFRPKRSKQTGGGEETDFLEGLKRLTWRSIHVTHILHQSELWIHLLRLIIPIITARLMKSNKQSIRTGKRRCGVGGGGLIGSMDLRWTGSGGCTSRWPGEGMGGVQIFFWQAVQPRRARGPGGAGMLIVQREERGENMCDKGEDGKHMSRFTLIYRPLPNPRQIKGGGGGGGKVSPL